MKATPKAVAPKKKRALIHIPAVRRVPEPGSGADLRQLEDWRERDDARRADDFFERHQQAAELHVRVPRDEEHIVIPEFLLVAYRGDRLRTFKVNYLERSPRGSSVGSFQISEIVDGQTIIRGFHLSWPTFEACCFVTEQSLSKRPVRTNTYLIKEMKMAVKKKSSSKPAVKPVVAAAPAKKLTKKEQAAADKLAAKAAKAANAAKKKHVPPAEPEVVEPTPTVKGVAGSAAAVAIVVQAKDGKWVYGREADEKKLIAMPKGKYDCAADASQAAGQDHDIIVNTSKEAPKSKPKSWGGVTPPAASMATELAKAATPKEKKTSAAPSGDVVSLKKVCADANIDPRLARRILRTKGKKPGGRWEWNPKDVAGVVELLKVEAKKLEGK